MKIILSIDAVKFPLTGVGRYNYELCHNLQLLNLDNLSFLYEAEILKDIKNFPANNDYRKNLFDNSFLIKKFHWLKEQLRKNFLLVKIYRKIKPKIQLHRNFLMIETYRLLNRQIKSRALKGMEDHIFHGTNFYLPDFKGKSIVTIHDLSPFQWTQCIERERVRYMQSEIKFSLKRASAIITPSHFTRLEVSKFFNWPLDKVFATPLASAPEFFPRTPLELISNLSALGLRINGYTFFTGTIEPRKNLSVLIYAYSRLPLNLRLSFPLVIAGAPGWKSEAIHERMVLAEKEGWLRYLGYVSSELLPIVMAGAQLFAFPSLYEGFGLPVIEAMTSGVPVICSNIGTLIEVAGNAATFHDPADVELLSQLLERGLTDETWRQTKIIAGLERAKNFSWQQCAKDTVLAYTAVDKM